MPRYKKKMTKDQLEEHVLGWAFDELEELRDISMRILNDPSVPDDEIPWIFGGISRQVMSLIKLLVPFDHDQESLLEWAQDFVTQYEQESYDYSYRSMN